MRLCCSNAQYISSVTVLAGHSLVALHLHVERRLPAPLGELRNALCASDNQTAEEEMPNGPGMRTTSSNVALGE